MAPLRLNSSLYLDVCSVCCMVCVHVLCVSWIVIMCDCTDRRRSRQELDVLRVWSNAHNDMFLEEAQALLHPSVQGREQYASREYGVASHTLTSATLQESCRGESEMDIDNTHFGTDGAISHAEEE